VIPAPTASTAAATGTVFTPPITTTTIPTTTTVPVQTYSNPKTYHVTRTLTITNKSAGVKSVRVWLPAPTLWDSQKFVAYRVSTPIPGVRWQDPQTGTEGIFIEVKDSPAAGSSLAITDEFTFTCYEVNFNVNPAQIQTYDKTEPLYALNTQSQYFIESDDPDIARTAGELKGSQTNPYEIAKTYYQWVMEHMTYQLVGGLKGARFALVNGYGECGDYTCLFTALCRAAGIPARPVVGRWATSKKNDWHVWAEFYLPGCGWVPADPTVEDNSGGNYFGRLDNGRLIFNKQCDAVLDPAPLFFPGVCAILQTWLWEYQGVTGDISTDLDYNIVPADGN
jgi:transglutaminase-like putative cysteine protease